MGLSSLALASLLICIPLAVSYKEHLGLGKDIVISILRAIVQLVIVGYVLEMIFGFENPVVISLFILFMILNGSMNASKRGKGIERVKLISFIAISGGAILTLIVLILTGAVSFTAGEVIPISGMLISNAMIAIGLCYRQLETSFQMRRMEIEVKLSLGADVKSACKELLRECIKTSMIPSLDSAKTLGIVSLPGMMTGLILAGTSPLEAIKFQMMVTFMTLSAASIAMIIAVYMSYGSYFNERLQLKIKN